MGVELPGILNDRSLIAIVPGKCYGESYVMLSLQKNYSKFRGQVFFL